MDAFIFLSREKGSALSLPFVEGLFFFETFVFGTRFFFVERNNFIFYYWKKKKVPAAMDTHTERKQTKQTGQPMVYTTYQPRTLRAVLLQKHTKTCYF